MESQQQLQDRRANRLWRRLLHRLFTRVWPLLRGIFGPLLRRLLGRVWYVHNPVILLAAGSRQDIIKLLGQAARPSVHRLHQRSLFTSGRRYFIQPRPGGFRLTTTVARRWRYRRRTSSIVVMWGTFADVDDNLIRLTLETRVNVGYLLDTFLIPVAMGTLLVYMPWPPLTIGLLLALLTVFSWIGHRSNVVLEGREMIWFAHKALADLVPTHIAALEAGGGDQIYSSEDFESAWEKFVQDHQPEAEDGIKNR